jgi:hypothetical protein
MRPGQFRSPPAGRVVAGLRRSDQSDRETYPAGTDAPCQEIGRTG